MLSCQMEFPVAQALKAQLDNVHLSASTVGYGQKLAMQLQITWAPLHETKRAHFSSFSVVVHLCQC